MAEPFIGEIRIFGGNFAPVGWAECNGQALPIAENTALFQLLGTTYGGDGVNTFNLPDLQGRLPIHQGTDSQGTSWIQGQKAGSETVTLLNAQLPSHTHAAFGTNAAASATSPAGNLYAVTTGANAIFAPATAGALSPMAPASISQAGSGQPHDNMMPFLAFTFIIALNGIFPTQN